MSAERTSSQPAIGQKRKKSQKGRRPSLPQRTCVGCRTVSTKRAMTRVVRTPEGTVEIDPTGKRSGRGAYLCQQKSCWESALKRRSLEHALKTTLDESARAALVAYLQTLQDDSERLPPVAGDEHCQQAGRE